jgi:RNA polymerase sigma-70 factor (ECF subfamily)
MDDPAFVAAISAELPRLQRLAQRVACPATDPDDLVQDTLERAWRSRDRFRADATAATWLHRILVNRAIDLCRRAGRTAATGLDGVDDERLLDVEIADPGAVIAAAEDASRLRVALSRLGSDERMILVLHDGEGWSARRIGEVCGLPTGTVHKRLQRGRVRLLRVLAGTTAGAGQPAENCRRARSEASDYVDGLLNDAQAQELEAHIESCMRCPAIVQALLGLKAALGREPRSGTPADLTRALRVMGLT